MLLKTGFPLKLKQERTLTTIFDMQGLMLHRKHLCGSDALDQGNVEELILKGTSNFSSVI